MSVNRSNNNNNYDWRRLWWSTVLCICVDRCDVQHYVISWNSTTANIRASSGSTAKRSTSRESSTTYAPHPACRSVRLHSLLHTSDYAACTLHILNFIIRTVHNSHSTWIASTGQKITIIFTKSLLLLAVPVASLQLLNWSVNILTVQFCFFPSSIWL